MESQSDSKLELKRSSAESNGPEVKRRSSGDTKEALDMVQIRLLIPTTAAGAIIGKGGVFMRTLKNETKCRLVMSSSTEIYPMTSERICTIKGRVKHVLLAIEMIAEKIGEKVEYTSRDPFDLKDVPRAHEVKILMPNTSAGVVIGKFGNNIKEIREEIGCLVQVYPRSGSTEASMTLERVVTIGQEDSKKLLAGVKRVLEKVVTDPQHGRFADHKEYDSRAQSAQSSHSSLFQGLPTEVFSDSGNISSHQYSIQLQQFMAALQTILRTTGYGDLAIQEIMIAVQTLAKYNVLGLGFGLGSGTTAQLRPGNEFGSVVSSNRLSLGVGSQYWGYPPSPVQLTPTNDSANWRPSNV